MSNQYTFHCPVKKEGAAIAHCEKVHSNGMQGKPHETEDKVCALAHACFMCPFRNAVRVGGPWSHPDKMPRSEKPQEKPAKLPPSLVSYSLSHTEPNSMDYRRVGLRGDDVGSLTGVFRDLQSAVIGDLTSSKRAFGHSNGEVRPAAKEKPSSSSERAPASAVDAMMEGFNENEMAEAVSDLSRKERHTAPEKRKSGNKQSAPAKSRKRSQGAAQSVSAPTSKPMSLAERAKLMKERRKA